MSIFKLSLCNCLRLTFLLRWHRDLIESSPDWTPFIVIERSTFLGLEVNLAVEEQNKQVDHDAMVALSERASLKGKRGEERLREVHEEIVDRQDKQSFGSEREIVATSNEITRLNSSSLSVASLCSTAQATPVYYLQTARTSAKQLSRTVS